jgi:hypothetical protein
LVEDKGVRRVTVVPVLTFSVAFCCALASAQVRKRGPAKRPASPEGGKLPKAERTQGAAGAKPAQPMEGAPTSSALKKVQIGLWGVVSVSAPAEYVELEEAPAAESHKNNDVTWTEYTRGWEKAGEVPRNMLLRVTTWDVDWAKVTGRGYASESSSRRRTVGGQNTEGRPGGRPSVFDLINEPCRARTCDPLVKSQLLYQLS